MADTLIRAVPAQSTDVTQLLHEAYLRKAQAWLYRQIARE